MDIKSFEPLFGEWYAESLIGTGSFGRVYKAYRDEMGERFYAAIKHISVPADESETNSMRNEGMDDKSISSYYATLVRDITAETRLMNRLKGYSNIVSYEDSRVIEKPDGIGYDIFIRMELLESLPAYIRREKLTRDDIIKLGAD
ncbi:MAG: serine/threonine protein kinase, partial [Clostridia bacterium]|nr:serine/threonine protein kinase [Clostridia bacterium]